MRIRTTMLALGLSLGALAAAPAFATGAQAATSTTEHKPMTAQQQKMATCSHESKGMKGDAHKKFMSDCMHGKTTAKTSQQEKMKTCNADANTKNLKGAERKSFMSTCLKG
ncbi:MAG TPA: PsiF family protein [Rhodanobacteraceae bacterium]|nr:PsiF family protein [Rhodanobacteraceae bacterium]